MTNIIQKVESMNKQKIAEELQQIIQAEHIKQDEPLREYTFTKTGGNADFLVLPTTYEEVQNTILYARKNDIPLTILGNGSNLIVRDGGIRGIVLILSHLDKIYMEDGKIVAESGATIIDVSRFALEQQLTGLEFACGIPGSVGGAVYMNAGAYGGEIAHVIESAVVLNEKGELLTLTKDEMELTYRSSLIAKQNYIVLEARFAPVPGDVKEIKEKMDELTFLRESKQPLEYPSCGSVFKRPPGYFAGKLIQDSGLQGAQIGGAQVSTKHAGFIINTGNATATDYLALIKHVQDTVKANFGVSLETEVKIIGEE